MAPGYLHGRNRRTAHAVGLIVLALPCMTASSAHAQVTQPQLRTIVQENMKEDGEKGRPPDLELRKGILKCIPVKASGLSAIDRDESWQYSIEGLRNALTNDHQKAFWSPYIERLEKTLAEKMDYELAAGRTGPDLKLLAEYDKRIETTYDEAFRDLAGRLSAKFVNVIVRYAPQFWSVRLNTQTGRGTILLMPRTKYKIAVMSKNEPAFREYPPGTKIALSGTYVYKIRDEDGSETPIKTIAIAVTGKMNDTIVLR
jgi:hypothetical protein